MLQKKTLNSFKHLYLQKIYSYCKAFLESTPRLKNIFRLLLTSFIIQNTKLSKFLSLILKKLLSQSGPTLASQKIFSCEANIKYFDELRASLPHLDYKPLISIIVPVYKTKHSYLEQMLESIAFQIYPNWQLCIVDDHSKDLKIQEMITKFADRFPGKVSFKSNDKNEHISITSNHALELAKGEYSILLDHDDRLYPQALIEVVRHIKQFNKPDILYSDERKIDHKGDLLGEVFLKPNFSPNLLLTQNYITHLLVCQTHLIKDCGGFRPGFEGAQDHDLILRLSEKTDKPIIHIPLCLYQWRAHSESVAENMDNKPYASLAGKKVVKETLKRRKKSATVIYKEAPHHHYEISYDIQEPKPLVSIIIPSKDNTSYLKKCLESIISKSSYPNFEIIVVDNGSQSSSFSSLISKYRQENENFFTVYEEGPFNFAFLNQKGSEKARGEYLIFLNDDCQVISNDWISQLLQYAQKKDIGAVGAKLLYPNKTIQHAGIFLRGSLVAAHYAYKLEDNKTFSLNNGILNKVHEVSAVTGACLMIRKDLFHKIDGFDKTHVPNGYGDIDLCLRLREKNFLIIYNPNAVLFHHESISDNRCKKNEIAAKHYMRKRFGQILLNDPYHNPNTSFNSFHHEPNEDMNQFEISGDLFNYLLKNPQKNWNTQSYKDNFLRS